MLREAKWVVETTKAAMKEAKGDGAAFKAHFRKAHAQRLRQEHGLVVEAVTEEEMTKSRDYSAGTFRLGLEDTMSVARWVGDNLISTGELQEVEDVVARMKAVTAGDIQRVAQRLFVNNELSMAMTGPNDETEGLRKVAASL